MGEQGQLMYPLELQTTPKPQKIQSREPSAVTALRLQKSQTRRSSLWALLFSPHTSTVKAKTHDGAANLHNDKKI